MRENEYKHNFAERARKKFIRHSDREGTRKAGNGVMIAPGDAYRFEFIDGKTFVALPKDKK